MNDSIESDVKKLYKKGTSRNDIVSYIVDKYNMQNNYDKYKDINEKIMLLEMKKVQMKNSVFMDKEDKGTYYFGIVVAFVVSEILFYEKPILIPINLSVYGISIPVIKAIYKFKKEKEIKKQLEILKIIKECLDNIEIEEKIVFVKTKK